MSHLTVLPPTASVVSIVPPQHHQYQKIVSLLLYTLPNQAWMHFVIQIAIMCHHIALNHTVCATDGSTLYVDILCGGKLNSREKETRQTIKTLMCSYFVFLTSTFAFAFFERMEA